MKIVTTTDHVLGTEEHLRTLRRMTEATNDGQRVVIDEQGGYYGTARTRAEAARLADVPAASLKDGEFQYGNPGYRGEYIAFAAYIIE